MNCRFSPIGSLAAAVALSAMALSPAAAQKSVTEDSLFGIKLMGTYKDVLRKFKQPNEIQVGSPVDSVSGNSSGGGGGFGGFGGRGPGRAGGGGPGRTFGGGGHGFAGANGGGGGGGTLPGFGGGGGLPGSGGPGGPSGMGGGRRPGAPNSGATSSEDEEDAGEVTWWYHDEKKQFHIAFLFNKQGRVIQIQEYGFKGGGKTRAGAGLGSNLNEIIHDYGWSDNGSPNGQELVLRYGGTDKVQFQLYKNKVVGITVGIVHNRPPVNVDNAEGVK